MMIFIPYCISNFLSSEEVFPSLLSHRRILRTGNPNYPVVSFRFSHSKYCGSTSEELNRFTFGFQLNPLTIHMQNNSDKLVLLKNPLST